MDIDEDDFVFYGTPIEREEELNSRKKKAVAEASGHLRTLPSWKQEVRDEEGRRRFHGAFTGGFSAGYYNTAGSKEGWTPQSFTSSRKNRAEFKQQSMLNFLDEDEKEELEGRSLGTASQFDTFGFTAAEIARKQAEKEQQQRPSAVPGPAPDEIVLPATESIGVKLLLKMGWRHGHSIKDSHANSLYKARREARKAFLAFSSDDAKSQPEDSEPGEEDHKSILDHQPIDDGFPSSQSTPVYILNPKEDTHGLGYDPYKHAPEFREKKRTRVSGKRGSGNKQALSIKDSLFGLKSGRAAPGFGIGALEDYDAEDEDVYATAYDIEDTYIQEDEEPLRSNTENKPKLVWKEQGVLPGFKVASNSDYQLERFDPPVIPKDFLPHHKFPGPLEFDKKPATLSPPPPEVPPPEDDNSKVLIEGVATLVARCGKLFEDLSREKNQSNPLFSFLTGGNGHDYYSRKLWEEQQKRNGQKKIALDGKLSSSVDKMTVESRGKILGEMPLERSSRDLSSSIASVNVNLPFNLSDTFTKPESSSEFPEVAKPLYEALQKVKEELMLLGFISLLLTVSQNSIAKTCVPENVVNDLLPCRLSEKQKEEGLGSNSTTTPKHYQSFFPGTISGTVRRLLAEASEANLGYCAKKGKVPLLSLEAIHHLHIFIFVLAIVHVTFCVLTILFGGARIRQWKHWENEIANDRCDTEQVLKKKFTHVQQHTFIKEHFLGIGKNSALRVWLHSFFKQFYASVTKSDYITLRLGFIMTHTRGNPKFNFHRYMVRSLEDDFKTVVGISWYLWVFVVIFLLLNINGWHTYFWIAFIPLILLLAVGTKLEHVINQLAYEVAEKHVAIEGELVVQPSDNHFWFHRPGFVHLLIHFILFQNAFEIAFFFWIWVQYGFDSCIMGQIKYIVPRLIIGVFIQVLCSYSTLPLYAIVSQMGSTFKKSIFEEHVQAGLVGWAQKVKKKRGQKGSTEGSSEASSHVSAGGLLLGRLKGLKEANEGSAQSSSHEGSTLGNNASAPPVPREVEP